MSIKKMEEIKDGFLHFDNEGNSRYLQNEADMLDIALFMQETINTLKEQSDAIADLRKELAKKEDIFANQLLHLIVL